MRNDFRNPLITIAPRVGAIIAKNLCPVSFITDEKIKWLYVRNTGQLGRIPER